MRDLEFLTGHVTFKLRYTVNNYRQVTGMVTGENFAFFIYSSVPTDLGN
jgi:hypothetical protein